MLPTPHPTLRPDVTFLSISARSAGCLLNVAFTDGWLDFTVDVTFPVSNHEFFNYDCYVCMWICTWKMVGMV